MNSQRALKVAAVFCLLLSACQERPQAAMAHEQWIKAVRDCINADNVPDVRRNHKGLVTEVGCFPPADIEDAYRGE